jgi:hypothetical protein
MSMPWANQLVQAVRHGCPSVFAVAARLAALAERRTAPEVGTTHQR